MPRCVCAWRPYTKDPTPMKLTRRHSNPASACLPKRIGKAPYNVHEGQVITYRGTRYKIIGCGIGETARRSIGVQVEGTYALLNEKTNHVIYVAKRVVRDIAYHRGIEGRPSAKGPLTAAKRKIARKSLSRKLTQAEKDAIVDRMASRRVKNPSRKMSAADKAAFVKRMAAGRARAGR